MAVWVSAGVLGEVQGGSGSQEAVSSMVVCMIFGSLGVRWGERFRRSRGDVYTLRAHTRRQRERVERRHARGGDGGRRLAADAIWAFEGGGRLVSWLRRRARGGVGLLGMLVGLRAVMRARRRRRRERVERRHARGGDGGRRLAADAIWALEGGRLVSRGCRRAHGGVGRLGMLVGLRAVCGGGAFGARLLLRGFHGYGFLPRRTAHPAGQRHPGLVSRTRGRGGWIH